MNLKESKTKENLLRAFAGESQARNRYDISANAAKKESLFIIEKLFKYTANQEKIHAELFFERLKVFNGEEISIEGSYPVSAYDKTADNLHAANNAEHHESDVVYIEFAKVAKEEGFDDIATLFEKIATIEKVHGDRFKKYEDRLNNGTLFKESQSIQWMCTNCGYVYEGTEAPKVCPVCKVPQGYYIRFNESDYE